MASRIKCTTPHFRVSFPSIFQASAAPGSDKKHYSVVAIFDKKKLQNDPASKELFAKMKQAMQDCAREKWGDKIPKNLTLPFRDGSEKETVGYGPETIFITFKTEEKNGRPGLVDQQMNRIINESDFYPGCYAHATVNPYAWEYMGKAGISFGLQNIQKTADGEPLGGGRAKAEDDFSAVAGGDAPAGGEDFGNLFK